MNPPAFVEVVPAPPVRGAIRPPGSKSLTNRALLCAALADRTCRLSGVLRSDDTAVMLDGLQRAGAGLEIADQGRRVAVDRPLQPRPTGAEIDLFIGNSGTTVRFLTAALSALGGRYRLDGVPRMRERPIADLLDAIGQLGGEAVSEQGTGCPPVRIAGTGWRGGRATVSGAISSQYLSGLLMAAPLARRPVEIVVDGPLVSRPYVDMTCRVMEAFGVAVQEPQPNAFRVDAPRRYRATGYEIEPDASAASYPWAAAAITGGTVTVEGLHRGALQGDVRFCEVLEQMGCRVEYGDAAITVAGRAARGIDVDMNAISDTVQTLAVVALFAEGTTTIRGVAHNRFKETDRIGDLARELRKLGAEVTETPDGLRITPGPHRGATIETYDDHRMAMSFALAGLVIPGVRLLDPGCTAKTYPEFFTDLQRLAGTPLRWGD